MTSNRDSTLNLTRFPIKVQTGEYNIQIIYCSGTCTVHTLYGVIRVVYKVKFTFKVDFCLARTHIIIVQSFYYNTVGIFI